MIWWRLLKPEGWTIEHHIADPLVGTNGPEERRIAKACGQLAKEQYEKVKTRREARKRQVPMYFLNERHTIHVTKAQARKERARSA